MKNSKGRFLTVVLLWLALIAIFAQDYSFTADVSGKKKGKDIILIPGLSCSGEVWNQTVAHYSKDYNCHVLTLPGFADCAPVEFGENYSNFISQQLLGYIKENKIDKPYVLGHSYGGFLALKTASENPQLFEKIIIVDALPFLPAIMNPMATIETGKQMGENMKQQMLGRQPGQGAEYLRPMMQSLTIDTAYAETILSWSLESDPKSVAYANYDLYAIDLRAELSKIECPILVMGAWIAYKNYGVTHESTLQGYSRQYSQAKNAEVVLTDKGRHFIMHDDAEFFFEKMDAFIAESKK